MIPQGDTDLFLINEEQTGEKFCTSLSAQWSIGTISMDKFSLDKVNIPKKLAKQRANLLKERAERDFRHQLEAAESKKEASKEPQGKTENREATESKKQGYKEPQSKREWLEEKVKNFRHVTHENKARKERKEQIREVIDQFAKAYKPIQPVLESLEPVLQGYQKCQKDLTSGASMEELKDAYGKLYQLYRKLEDIQITDVCNDIKAFLCKSKPEMEKAKVKMDGFNEKQTFGPYSNAFGERMEKEQKRVADLVEELEKFGRTGKDAEEAAGTSQSLDRASSDTEREETPGSMSLETFKEEFKGRVAQIQERGEQKLPTLIKNNFDKKCQPLEDALEKLSQPVETALTGRKKLSTSPDEKLSIHELQQMRQNIGESLKKIEEFALDLTFQGPFRKLADDHMKQIEKEKGEITEQADWLIKLDSATASKALQGMESHYTHIKNQKLPILKDADNGTLNDLKENLQNLSREVEKQLKNKVKDIEGEARKKYDEFVTKWNLYGSDRKEQNVPEHTHVKNVKEFLGKVENSLAVAKKYLQEDAVTVNDEDLSALFTNLPKQNEELLHKFKEFEEVERSFNKKKLEVALKALKEDLQKMNDNINKTWEGCNLSITQNYQDMLQKNIVQYKQDIAEADTSFKQANDFPHTLKTRAESLNAHHQDASNRLEQFERLQKTCSLCTKIEEKEYLLEVLLTQGEFDHLTQLREEFHTSYLSEASGKRTKGEQIVQNPENLKEMENYLSEKWNTSGRKIGQLATEDLGILRTKMKNSIECLSQYKAQKYDEKYSNLDSLLFDKELMDWHKKLSNSTLDSFYHIDYNDKLNQIQEDLELVSELLPGEVNKNNTKILEEVKKLQENLNTNAIPYKHLEQLSRKITIQECNERGNDLPKIIERRSVERNEDVIEKHWETCYQSSAQGLRPGDEEGLQDLINEGREPPHSELQNLIEKRLVPGKEDDYFYIETWPTTPDKTKSLKDSPPYRAYINPKDGAMISPWMYRDDDREYRRRAFPQEVSKELAEPLNASDVLPREWRLVVAEYKKRKGNDAPCSSLTMLLQPSIANEKTNTVLSLYPGKEHVLSNKKDRACVDGTPNGQIVPFMLAQNSKILGLREIKHVEVGMENGIGYIKHSIGEKDSPW